MTGLAHHAEEFTVQSQEEHVLVDELVVGRAVTGTPGLDHRRIAHVVIAGKIKKRHLELRDEAVDLVH